MTEANTAYDNNVSDPGLQKGTTLSGDQFKVTRRLSAGGFGITYLAEDITLGRTIVIKECFPDDLCYRDGHNVAVRNAAHLGQFQSITDMFMREARSLAKLRHPNIVGVHRAFEENGTAYMALDLIDGHDLLDILEAKTSALSSPARVKEILVQLLHAIETVHDHDLLHRDISPDNIIIEKNGTPVLIDFGAARGDASRRTRAISSMLVVKDGYSPQEFYIAGSKQTPSSDLYALASTFYHVITGKAPANSQIRMSEIAGQNPDPCVPLLGRIEGYDDAFLNAIDTAMQIVPRNRLQSAAEWRELITGESYSAANSAQAVTQSPPKTKAQELDRMLTRLIEETNEEVKKSKPEESEPVIEEVVAPKEAPKPEWLDEFNEESRRKEVVSAQIAEISKNDDEMMHEPIASAKVHDILERAKPDGTRRPRTRVIYAQEDPAPVDKNWTAQEKAKKEKERAQLELDRQALNEKFRTGSRLGPSSKRVVSDPDVFDPDYAKTQLVGPLAKYLVTGVVIGLGIILIYPNLV